MVTDNFGTTTEHKKTNLKLSSIALQTWPLVPDLVKKVPVPVLRPGPITAAGNMHPRRRFRLLHFLRSAGTSSGAG